MGVPYFSQNIYGPPAQTKYWQTPPPSEATRCQPVFVLSKDTQKYTHTFKIYSYTQSSNQS